MRARRIVVYIATSADGYIARPDGDVEWLNRRPRTGDYGMGEFRGLIDTVLFGRKTYDWAMAYWARRGKKTGQFDRKMANYVGEGIPLIAPRHRDVPLRLRQCRKYPDGVVRLRYHVERWGSRAASCDAGR